MRRQKKIEDLTLLYITANEMPEAWMQFQIETLQEAVPEVPIVSVSRKFLNLGINLADDGPKGYWNIYMQMLRAAKVATTPFVAMAEDDVLYTREHFSQFRPPVDAVSYDRSRWSLFAWEPIPIYCLRQRISNCSLIAPRELLIEALEERQAKWPDGAPPEKTGEVGRWKVEFWLKVTRRKMVEWFCTNAIVHLNHLTGTDLGDYKMKDGSHWYKQHGEIKAVEIPTWGRAEEIVRIYAPDRPIDPTVLAPCEDQKSSVVSPQRHTS